MTTRQSAPLAPEDRDLTAATREWMQRMAHVANYLRRELDRAELERHFLSDG